MTRPDQRLALRLSSVHAVARSLVLRAGLAWLVFAIAFGFTAAMVCGMIG